MSEMDQKENENQWPNGQEQFDQKLPSVIFSKNHEDLSPLCQKLAEGSYCCENPPPSRPVAPPLLSTDLLEHSKEFPQWGSNRQRAGKEAKDTRSKFVLAANSTFYFF
jgi:hypothetical protein